MRPTARSFAFAAALLVLLPAAPGPLVAQSVGREPVIVIGLRPTEDERLGTTEIRRLSEAQRLREIAGGVIRGVARRPVINHLGLREALGSAYLVDFVDCRGDLRCVSRLLAPLARRTPFAVYGDYSVERETYRFRVRLIDIRAARLSREVQFSLQASDLEDQKLWRRELAPLFADVAGEGPPDEPDPNQPPELAPITSEPDGDASPTPSSIEPSAVDTSSATGSSEAFVDDTALDAISRGVPFHGHFQNYAAVGTRGTFRRDILVFENRLQLEFESNISPLHIVGKPQLLYDWLDEEFRLAFRELYASRYYEHFDITVGEQILTWGVTDFWPVIDIVNPRDFTQLKNWRPIDEKLSIPVIHSAAVFGRLTAHFLAIPLTRSSAFQLDRDEPFALPIPAPPGAAVEQVALPDSLDRSGGGIALDVAVATWKLSLYGLWGRNPLPSIFVVTDPESMALTIEVDNERVAMGGMSLSGSIDAIGSLLKAEAAAYYRVDERCEGRDEDLGGVPACFDLRRVPTGRATIALERTVLPGLDAHVQYITEMTRGRDIPRVPGVVDMFAPGFPEQERYNPILTLRLQGRWLGDDFRPMAFAYWSLGDEDFFVNADFEYHVADGLALSVGGFWFEGYADDPAKNDYTLAGSLESSTNAYMRATAWF